MLLCQALASGQHQHVSEGTNLQEAAPTPDIAELHGHQVPALQFSSKALLQAQLFPGPPLKSCSPHQPAAAQLHSASPELVCDGRWRLKVTRWQRKGSKWNCKDVAESSLPNPTTQKPAVPSAADQLCSHTWLFQAQSTTRSREESRGAGKKGERVEDRACLSSATTYPVPASQMPAVLGAQWLSQPAGTMGGVSQVPAWYSSQAQMALQRFYRAQTPSPALLCTDLSGAARQKRS